MLRFSLRRLNSPQRFIQSFWKSSFLGTQLENIPRETADCVVIGAGVVGIAVARELALKGREVLVIESSSSFGTGTSSRNSEVIHAGIYYPAKSLKAALCIRGRELMYNYCSDRGVPHKKTGKLIVAARPNEIPKLRDLLKSGTENGVKGLRMMEGFEAIQMEPELQCVKALLSPCSGIVDSHSFMLSLLGEAENYGAMLCYNTTVTGGHIEENRVYLHISESKDLERCAGNHLLKPQLILIPKLVINSAGLSSISLAKRLYGLDHRVIPPSYYARGCYFTLSKTHVPPFKHLIYPIPEDGGLGVHVTLDLDGHVKFGPDVEWIDGLDDIPSFLNRFNYTVCDSRVERFYPEIRRYYPNLKEGSLEAGYAGIRAKHSAPGQPPMDFVIQPSAVPQKRRRNALPRRLLVFPERVIQWLGINMLIVTVGALSFVGGSYMSWLRVTQQLHTISQVVVGALLGSFLSIAWFWLWHTVVLKAFVSFLWVWIFVFLSSVGFCLAFLLYVIKYWLRKDN